MKRRSPKSEPWQTPLVTDCHPDASSFTTTIWAWSFRQSFTHWIMYMSSSMLDILSRGYWERQNQKFYKISNNPPLIFPPPFVHRRKGHIERRLQCTSVACLCFKGAYDFIYSVSGVFQHSVQYSIHRNIYKHRRLLLPAGMAVFFCLNFVETESICCWVHAFYTWELQQFQWLIA